jgi:hypothetical protein
MLLLFLYALAHLSIYQSAEAITENQPVIAFSFSNIPFVAKDGTADSLVSFHNYEKKFELTSTALVDDQPAGPNPLCGAQIDVLEMVQELPLMVTKKEPNVMYSVQALGDDKYPMVMATARGIKDAGAVDGKPQAASALIGLSFGATGTSAQTPQDYFFAAVSGHDAPFGQLGSGIALLTHGLEMGTEEKKNEKTGEVEKKEYVKRRYFMQLDAVGSSTHEPRAYPIDNRDDESNPVSIAGGLASIEPQRVSLHWDQNLRRLYVALQVCTKDTAGHDQGACALVVGRIENNKLYFEPIVPASLLAGAENTIVSACGPRARCAIRSVSTMRMSTGALYLVMVKEQRADTQDEVFVLPLVDRTHTVPFADWIYDKQVGTLARVDVDLVVTDSAGAAHTQAVTAQDQLPHSCDTRFKVGGGVQLPGSIAQCKPAGDAIYVSVRGRNGRADGFYVSCPIFDDKARVVSWTGWRRACATRATPLSFCFNSADRALYSIEQDEYGVVFHKTGWLQIDKDAPAGESSPVAIKLAGSFSPEHGGLQAVAQLALDETNVPTGLLLAAGYQKATLFNYNERGECQQYLFEDDAVLKKLGAVSAAAAHLHDGYVWLLVSGPRGLALLADDKGMPVPHDLFAQLKDTTELLSAYRWQLIDNFFARKMVCKDNAVWCMSDNMLEKRTIHDGRLDAPQRIFDSSDVGAPCRLNDMVVGKNLVLVGTSKGLFKKLNHQSLDEPWTQIHFFESGPIIACNAIAPAHRSFDQGGQLYVMSGSSLEGRAFIHRFYVSDGELTLVPYDQGKPILINCKGYRNNLFVEGSLFLMTKNITRGQAPALQWYQLLPPGYVLSFKYTNNTYIPIQVPHWTHMGQVIYDSITGYLMVCGDGGVYVRA